MLMCPDADPTDGLLDVVVAGPVNRRTLVGLFPKVFKGQHVAHPTVDVYRTRSVRIDADGIVGYADGERTCPLPMTVTAVPGALRVLV
jgi:diacylglycerol kinase (ATP)